VNGTPTWAKAPLAAVSSAAENKNTFFMACKNLLVYKLIFIHVWAHKKRI
jgi:hypothetical protein